MTDNNTALKKAGLKVTLPRLKILEVLQNPECHHVSAEDLYKKLIDMGEEIGLATVYRVLNQFDDAGIVTRHNFEGGKSVFELTQQHHHDHLICLDCGKVIEFSDESIEVRQRDIARFQQHTQRHRTTRDLLTQPQATGRQRVLTDQVRLATQLR